MKGLSGAGILHLSPIINGRSFLNHFYDKTRSGRLIPLAQRHNFQMFLFFILHTSLAFFLS
jgi:hypothetical protein